MFELPDGSPTSDEKKHDKEWAKLAKFLGKKLGLNVRDSHSNITFEEVYERSNGRTAVSQIFTIPRDLASRMYYAYLEQDYKIKELKDTLKEIEEFTEEVDEDAELQELANQTTDEFHREE
jgi:hypothetical protein